MSNMDLSFEDEIDLRNIIKTIWKARKSILMITLSMAVITFVISYWILPKQFEANTYVIITEPLFQYSLSQYESGLETKQILPDIKNLLELISAPEFLNSLKDDPEITAAFAPEGVTVGKLSGMLTAESSNKSQLALKVTDSDPERAALLANIWAFQVTSMINTTYGLTDEEQSIKSQVLQFQKDYEQTQSALEEAISKSQVPLLTAELQNSLNDLAILLANMSNANRLLDDLLFFEQGLSGVPAETLLSLGDGLALTNLRQRVLLVGSMDYTVQIDSASFIGFSVIKALEATAQMRTGLQDQLTRHHSEQIRLETEIPQLQRDLENASAQLNDLNLQNDQAYSIYTSLLAHQKQISYEIMINPQLGQVPFQALPPEKPVSPKPLINTVLLGMFGLILSVIWALVIDWWKRT